MSVRHGLLAILTVGDAYGYQLRQEFSRRTDGVWALNVGQVYQTLDRLERDKLVEQLAPGADGHARFRITVAGRAEAERWLAEPVQRADRDELAIKLAVARTLPNTDMEAIIAAQRSLESISATGVVGAWLEAVAEAERRWLDVVAALPLDPQSLAEEVPKRGRPARTPA